MDHLGADFLGNGRDKLGFAINLAAVADDAAKAHAAGIGVLLDTLADVVGGVEGHHFARSHDVDFLGLAFTDGHGETAAHNVAQNVIEHVVEVFGVGAKAFQQTDGGDDAAPGTANARFGAAGFHAADALEAVFEHQIQLDVFTLFAQGIEHALLGKAAQNKARGIGLGVTAHDHDVLAHFAKAGVEVLCGGGLADTALAVNSYLTHENPSGFDVPALVALVPLCAESVPFD